MSAQSINGENIENTLGIENPIRSIFEYILIAVKVLEITANILAFIDLEIWRYLILAYKMLNKRGNIIMNIARDIPSHDNNFYTASDEFPLYLYLPSHEKCLKEINISNYTNLLESVEIALNDNISNNSINDDIIISLSKIIDSEKYIINSEADYLFIIPTHKNQETLNMIKNTSPTIISLINKSLRILRDKILATPGLYTCLECGFRIEEITNNYKCEFCGASKRNISKINI